MKTVNALEIRNHLGSILDELEREKEPILISKSRTVRGVLITPEDFRRRFVDIQAEEEKIKLLRKIEDLRTNRKGDLKSLDFLREMRGYTD